MTSSIKDIMQEIHIENIVATASISDKLDLKHITEILPGSQYDMYNFSALIYQQDNPNANSV